MFYAILKESPFVFAVQPNDPQLGAQAAAELIDRLEKHFQHPIAIVAWTPAGEFIRHGFPASEEAVTSEDLVWREFELPAEPDVPF